VYSKIDNYKNETKTNKNEQEKTKQKQNKKNGRMLRMTNQKNKRILLTLCFILREIILMAT
jgi:hypothetical protein